MPAELELLPEKTVSAPRAIQDQLTTFFRWQLDSEEAPSNKERGTQENKSHLFLAEHTHSCTGSIVFNFPASSQDLGQIPRSEYLFLIFN